MNKFFEYFKILSYEDRIGQNKANLLNAISIIHFISILLYLFFEYLVGSPVLREELFFISICSILFIPISTQIALRLGYLNLASFITTFMLWLFTTIYALFVGGFFNPAYISLTIVILFAAVLVEKYGVILFTSKIF